MRIAFNPKSVAPLTAAPTGNYLNAITFDLAGHNIFTRGEMFKGTDTTYEVFRKATQSAVGYNGLVPAPSYDIAATRFLREDGTWVVPTNTWRDIKVNGTQIAGTGTGTYSVDYLSGDGISVTGVAGTSTTKNNTITITNTGVRSVTIGTGDNANKVAVNTGGTTTYLTIPYATYSTHLIGGAQGSIPYQSAADTTTFLAAPTTNGYVLKYNTTDKKPYWAADSNTKNTAGSTNSTSKLFLIGATSQAANPQTYSNSAVFATNGTLNATNFVSGAGVSDFSAGTVKLDTLNIPTASGGTTFGPGTSGQVLKSNGTTVYWASDSNSDTKVTQTITTTNASYRVLFSATADDTTRTEAARKATNLLFNPSSGLLTAGGFVKSGSSDSYVLLGGGGHKALSELGGVSGNYVLRTGDTMTGNLQFTGGDYGRYIVIDKASASIHHYATTTSGWAMGSYIKDNAGNSLGTIAGAYGTTNTLTYYYYGGNWDNPIMLLYPGQAQFNYPVTLAGELYEGNYALNLSNSDIININALFTADLAENGTEGLQFSRGDGYYDSVWAASGVLYFSPNGNLNRTGSYGTNHTVWHSGNLKSLPNLGNTPAVSGTTLIDQDLRLYSIYGNGYPCTYGNLLRIGGGGYGELACEWKADTSVGRMYYRSKRDVESTAWSGWATVAYTSDIPTANNYLHYNGWWTNGSGQNVDNARGMTFCYSNHGVPGTWGTLVNFSYGGGQDYVFQLFSDGWDNRTYFRNRSVDRGGWLGWHRLVTQSFDSSITATAFYSSSDINLKTNIQVITNSNNIPELKEFDWKKDGSHSYGLIAQELEEQGYTELVSINEDGEKSVNYSAALSLIVGKLQVKIKELEKEIETLKNKN